MEIPKEVKVLRRAVCVNHQMMINQRWNKLALSGERSIKDGTSSTKKKGKYIYSYRNRWTRVSVTTSHKGKDAEIGGSTEHQRTQGPQTQLQGCHGQPPNRTSDEGNTRAGP